MTQLLYSNLTDDKVTRTELATLPTPAPIGPRHKPYPFYGFVSDVVREVEARGHTVMDEEYAVTKDKQRLFGLMSVRLGDLPEAADYRMLVGVRGAHDQAFCRGITLGSQVMVCSNLCFHGDLGVWKTKQSTNIRERLPELITRAISELPSAARSLTVKFDQMRETFVGEKHGCAELARIYRAKGLSAAQLGRAVDEWLDPSHPEHAEQGWSAWRLFNAATEAIKPTGTSGDPVYLQRKAEIIHQHFTQRLAA